MKSSLLITNVRLVDPSRGIVAGSLLARSGRITAIGEIDPADAAAAVCEDGGGRLLSPGLIDLHTHGLMHSIYETGPEGLHGAAEVLGRFGVTTVAPTIIPRHGDDWLEHLRALAEAIPSIHSVHIPGLHIEGPFVAIAGAACPTVAGDLALLDRILAAGGGRIAAMSVSPDTPNILPVIHRLRDNNIAVFITHTRASVEQTEAALAAGATHATHFYDVFYSPPETDPGVRPVGVVEAVLADPGATVDFIADGVHVHPAAIRAAVAAKSWRGVVLITDSNIGAGLPPGVFDTSWGFQVRVNETDGVRHITQNTLAGSALTMDRGLANLMRWLDLPREQVWAMATANPARVLGLAKKGSLRPGADADLVLWDDDFRVVKTWVSGKCIHENKSA